jgi:hypothetical protein
LVIVPELAGAAVTVVGLAVVGLALLTVEGAGVVVAVVGFGVAVVGFGVAVAVVVGAAVVGAAVVGAAVVGAAVVGVAGARTSCWVTCTEAELAEPSTLTTVWAVTAPVGTGRAAETRVQLVGLTAWAVPPVHERNVPVPLNHETVICALAPVLALTSEAKVQVVPARTLTLGSRIRVVVAVDVTLAAQAAAMWSVTDTRVKPVPPSWRLYPRRSDLRTGLGDRFSSLEGEPPVADVVAAMAATGTSATAVTRARTWSIRRVAVGCRRFVRAAWAGMVVPRLLTA